MNTFFYSFIVPTYKRPELLLRCVNSILHQKKENLEIIIVNDSPDFDYSSFEKNNVFLNASVRYFKNIKNFGVNYTRNKALSLVDDNSDYVIFLDDDDYLQEDSLNLLDKRIQYANTPSWMIADAYIHNQKNNSIKKIKKEYRYFSDYLILKNFSGDCSHVIKSDLAKKNKFPECIKNGEEWLYFINIQSKIVYMDLHIKNIGDYYEEGLTKLTSQTNQYTRNTFVLWYNIGTFFSFKTLFYLSIRTIKLLFNTQKISL